MWSEIHLFGDASRTVYNASVMLDICILDSETASNHV